MILALSYHRLIHVYIDHSQNDPIRSLIKKIPSLKFLMFKLFGIQEFKNQNKLKVFSKFRRLEQVL